MKPKRVTRTNFLIFPEFQLKLLFANLGVIVVISSIIWFEMSQSFTDLGQAAAIAGVEGEFYRNYIAYHSHQLHVALAISFMAATIASALMTLMISHRFSGPLVRLRGYFRQLTEHPTNKPLPKLSFRRNDFLSDIPPLVNTALDRLHKCEGPAEAGTTAKTEKSERERRETA